MNWNIAQAKQQFSEVVRLSAQMPQAIYKRDKAVAALVNAADFAQFQQWRDLQRQPLLTAQFDEIRLALAEAGLDGLQIPDRQSLQRPNAFDQMLDPGPPGRQAREKVKTRHGAKAKPETK